MRLRFDPKVTSPGECGTLSGNLCSRKDIKCGATTTDFLDAQGLVIATGGNGDMVIRCSKGTDCVPGGSANAAQPKKSAYGC